MGTLPLTLLGPVLVLAVACLGHPQHPGHAGLGTVTLANRTNCGDGDVAPPDRANTTVRVANLMALMNKNKYSGYVIVTSDDHQSEYTPIPDLRREYISGFTGSAGTAVVLTDGQRALWTDGRYFQQADNQLDCSWLLMKMGQPGVPDVLQFLQQAMEAEGVASADSSTFPYGDWLKLSGGLSADRFVESPEDLVDAVWEADDGDPRPEYSSAPAFVYPAQYAGRTVSEKLADVRAAMGAKTADVLVVTALDEVAWLYNIRGDDILYNPVVRSFAIVTDTSAFLYINQSKITKEVKHHLGNVVEVADYDQFYADLSALSGDASVYWVLLPDNTVAKGCSYKVYDTVDESKRLPRVTPTLELKVMKNDVEIANMKAAHIKDGVALCDFLAFMEKEITAGRNWTEIAALELLAAYRGNQTNFYESSFGTICSYGPHSAIIHYEATAITDAVIGTESLLLLDSGGQYLDGTTDITRTMHYGTPTDEMKEMYTRVLMGHIDLANLTFPQGETMYQLDILPRRAIFAQGQNYRHGTSHGVGMFLNVHEPLPDDFKPGYVRSDEPGWYKDGEWGIRIENVFLVVDTQYKFDVPYYAFETISLAPMEPKLIEVSLLTDYQLAWLNEYHVRVRELVGPVMQQQGLADGYQWMLDKTEPIVRGAAGSSLSVTATHQAVMVVVAVVVMITSRMTL